MSPDEQFASDLRPDSIFGSLGASDHFDDEVEEYGDIDNGWGVGADPVVETEVAPVEDAGYAEPSYTQQAATQPALAPAVVPAAQPSGRGGAAVTLFLLVGGGALGWHFGKLKGAAGGVLSAGALRNLYRAQRGMRSPSALEQAGAIRPGLIGLLGLGLGGYLLYKAQEGK